MKKLTFIIIVLLAVALAVSAEEPAAPDSSKKIESIRDETTGALTVKPSETKGSSKKSSVESEDERFDVGGFLRDLFKTASESKTESRTSMPSTPKRTIRQKSSGYDTFEDHNDNGIDDRLEKTNSVKSVRKKK